MPGKSIARAESSKAEGAGSAELPAPGRRLVRSALAWYDRNRRAFPWRAPPGTAPDPYRVWLSEIMLQQTTTGSVKPYFERFVKRWPRLEDLAAAKLDEVLQSWQGLGYYARARNLHKCAKAVVERHGGRFPEEEKELLKLPGIGSYTAGAIAAIAFGKRAGAIDGNAARVLTRLALIETPWPEAREGLEALAAGLAPRARAGDFAQALMDLGATVCTPQAPDCPRCPWRRVCRARAEGRTGELPVKRPKRQRPLRHGVAFWTVRADGRVLLKRRPETGLLGGMMEVPSTAWRARRWSAVTAARHAPARAHWRELPGAVRHGFTHFRLELKVMAGRVERSDGIEGVWCLPSQLGGQALPTVMKKVARHALAHG